MQKLIKLLMLTSSDSDGEALNAIRKANGELKKLGMSWGELLQGSTSTEYVDELMGFKRTLKGTYFNPTDHATVFRQGASWKLVVKGVFLNRTFRTYHDAIRYHSDL